MKRSLPYDCIIKKEIILASQNLIEFLMDFHTMPLLGTFSWWTLSLTILAQKHYSMNCTLQYQKKKEKDGTV